MKTQSRLQTSPIIVMSGGGTGGHIYPAIGIAQALKRLDENVDIVFIGGEGRLESTLVPQHGFRFLPISVAGFPRRLTLQWFPVIWKVCRGLNQSLRYMKQLKPDIVIGTGGYVSGPVLFAGALRKIPIAIQEQNASVGLTNGILARWAKAVYLALEPVKAHLKVASTGIVEVTGNPIRPAISAAPRREATYSKFGLSPNRKTVFVMGGSQGAHAINEAMAAALPQLVAFADRLQVVHQTGAADAEGVQAAYQDQQTLSANSEKNLLYRVQPFFDAVEEVYSIADVMVCRAGGMTVSEVTACGIPAIFIPLPAQTGNNQVLNAQTIANAGAAVVLEQHILTADALVEHLIRLTTNEKMYQQMVYKSQAIGKPRASDDIAKSIYGLINASQPANAKNAMRKDVLSSTGH